MLLRLILSIITVTALVACGDSESPPGEVAAYTTISEPSILPGDDVPAPAGQVILTVTGRITNPNAADSLQFDMETLERLGLVEYSVDDKQAEGREATFRGVLLSQILDVAGAVDGATTLHTVALNDYAVEIPIDDVVTYPVLLATSVDGERMPVERYGPTRVIYPYAVYQLDEAIYDPRWIWQLASIDVR